MMMQSGWKLSARMPASKPDAAVSIRKSSLSRRWSRSTAWQRGVGPDDQDFMIDLGLEVAQGHSMLLEEPQEMLPRDATILRAGDAISTQAARVEPLAHGPGRDLANLRDLAGCEHLFHFEDSTRPVWCETSEVSSPLRLGTIVGAVTVPARRSVRLRPLRERLSHRERRQSCRTLRPLPRPLIVPQADTPSPIRIRAQFEPSIRASPHVAHVRRVE